jgi:aspartate-semialdehyde dehydrogenase
MAAAGSREPRVAVVGATGTVGSQIAALLRERAFGEFVLFNTEGGATDDVEADGEALEVLPLESPARLAGFDLALLAVPESVADEVVAARPGPILVDLSAAGRPPSNIPIVAPGLVARERVNQLKVGGLFAVPHPAAYVMATMVNALGIGVDRLLCATVVLSAGAAGRERVSELFNQSVDLLNARLDLEDDRIQLAFNLFNDAVARATAGVIAAQVRALNNPAVKLSLCVLQAPVYHGGAMVLHLSGSAELAADRARLRAAPGVLLVEGEEPIGMVDPIGQEAIITRLEAGAAGAYLCCMYDSARIAAANALWIGECLSFTASEA